MRNLFYIYEVMGRGDGGVMIILHILLTNCMCNNFGIWSLSMALEMGNLEMFFCYSIIPTFGYLLTYGYNLLLLLVFRCIHINKKSQYFCSSAFSFCLSFIFPLYIHRGFVFCFGFMVCYISKYLANCCCHRRFSLIIREPLSI